MVRNGPTKRKRGDIWAQLGVSACVLLLPPLVVAAGVMFYDSSPPQSAGPQSAAPRAEAPASSVAKTDSMAERSDMRSDAGTFALASAEKHPVITEKRPVAAPPAATAQSAAPVQRQAGGQPEGAKDPARYNGPAPTLVRAEKTGEQSAMAAIEAPPSAAKAADAPAAVPETSPAATRMRASRARGRHEPRAVYRVKQQRTRSLSDIFLRPTARPRRS
jgi:hypothetical protein